MFQWKQMERLPALHLAVVVLQAFCCLMHASSAEISFPPAPRVLQETKAISTSSGSDDQQAVFAGEVEAGGDSRRMALELEDYPGSGANYRHSPWGHERRN